MYHEGRLPVANTEVETRKSTADTFPVDEFPEDPCLTLGNRIVDRQSPGFGGVSDQRRFTENPPITYPFHLIVNIQRTGDRCRCRLIEQRQLVVISTIHVASYP